MTVSRLASSLPRKASRVAPSSSPFEDQSALLEALCKGDELAFRHVIETRGPALLSIACRFMGSEADARDVFQESMIRAFRKMDTFQGDGSFEGWLRKILVNVALQKLRQRKSRAEELIGELLPQFDDRGCRLEAHAPALPSAEVVLGNEQARRLVRQAIDELPETYRSVLLLRDIEGLSTQEAAKALGIEITATRVRLHRARAALKKLLEPLREQGVFE